MSTAVGLDIRGHSYPPLGVWDMGMGRCLFQRAEARQGKRRRTFDGSRCRYSVYQSGVSKRGSS